LQFLVVLVAVSCCSFWSCCTQFLKNCSATFGAVPGSRTRSSWRRSRKPHSRKPFQEAALALPHTILAPFQEAALALGGWLSRKRKYCAIASYGNGVSTLRRLAYPVHGHSKRGDQRCVCVSFVVSLFAQTIYVYIQHAQLQHNNETNTLS
jgi:hypothetical protein